MQGLESGSVGDMWMSFRYPVTFALEVELMAFSNLEPEASWVSATGVEAIEFQHQLSNSVYTH